MFYVRLAARDKPHGLLGCQSRPFDSDDPCRTIAGELDALEQQEDCNGGFDAKHY